MIGRGYKDYIKSAQATDTRIFDTIIIGSGTGGMSAASFLAQAGKRVLLLEQHTVLGGYSHTFSRKGYVWDVGLHYVGQVHIKGTALNKVFRYISQDQLQWAPLDDIYDRAIFGDDEYEFPRGRENLKAKLKQYFPAKQDKASIDKYFALLDQAQQLGSGYYVEKTLPPFLAKLFGDFLRRSTLKLSDRTTLEVLREITDNPKLIGVLTCQYGDYGLEPSKSSFYMHALLANHYMEGAGYPVGGASKLAECVVPIIEHSDGVALTQADVREIIVENNKAIGVRMSDGEAFYASTVVSATGIVSTYSCLLPNEVRQQHQLDTLIDKFEPATAHAGLYIGIKEPPSALNLPKCNYWIFPQQYDHDRGRAEYKDFSCPLPVAFVSFPWAKDPAAQQAHPGRSTAEVVILVPYGWFAQWENTTWQKRGEEYNALKEHLAQQMLEQLYRVAPQLKGKVDYYEVSTPLSTSHFSHHQQGEIYGLAHSPQRFRQKCLRIHTPVTNLFLSGQDVMTASIAGGTMAGLLCASTILKKNLLWTVNKTMR
ncbi:NAD(P)/FAD-dependent oxidoreductase [Photobacterium gaetbulicola]|uniref:Putative FAD dependent oxidoreductase n=1 Tax=Photobacterium gaetbulicola Gung47 TaxID=658445 RepID=A0A0C5WE38_9GAMM|nr:NAD(P)/FAD-dependent oxidoreductase [Photobacterium gaetbulicola]AJR05333.1 putative FAD dependent oxidoreductase [Photobacterium gaetbulicola Gung47]PSU12660.1 NAD(P)/FAD-dependent oxidoreductase [Photobacterium gaetbulicola]